MRACLVFLFVLLLSLPVLADSDEGSGPDDDVIRVSAEQMEADEKNRSVTFTGKVQARQGDMVMYAERMVLHYGAGESAEIERVEIRGGLRIVQADRIAKADTGLFLNREGQVLLQGNAEVHQGGNSIVGDEIIYYVNEARSVVKSQPDSRVNAVFRPGGNP